MSIFDFFKKKDDSTMHSAITMSGITPTFTEFGDSIYASDIIVQAIGCKANEFKKLDPRHIRFYKGAKTTITDSSIAKVLRNPNEYMTTADFLEKICILLCLNKNVFIYPTYYKNKIGDKVYTGLYPLKPQQVEYLSDESKRLFIKFSFANGNTTILPSSDVIHWRREYGVSDYFGGRMLGGNDNVGLVKMLKRYDKLTQGIANALEISCNINGILKYQSYLDDEKLEESRLKFEQDIKNNQSGIMFTDASTEYTHIPRDTKLVDSETLKFFYETILRDTGVPLEILNGSYTKEQKEAFYEHALESDIKSLGQAMTKVMMSDRQREFGNEIVLYPNNINFMSMQDKIAFANIAMPSGSLLKDEFRELFGYAPLPDGQGQVISQGYNTLLDVNNNEKGE